MKSGKICSIMFSPLLLSFFQWIILITIFLCLILHYLVVHKRMWGGLVLQFLFINIPELFDKILSCPLFLEPKNVLYCVAGPIFSQRLDVPLFHIIFIWQKQFGGCIMLWSYCCHCCRFVCRKNGFCVIT